MYFGLRKPLPAPRRHQGVEYPSPLSSSHWPADTRSGSTLEKPFWWDAPVWLASGAINSIGLANNHMCRDRMYESEPGAKPGVEQRSPLPAATVSGRRRSTTTCSIAVARAAVGRHALGRAPQSGRIQPGLRSPQARLFVRRLVAGPEAGRSFVTNGPLLLCHANGHSPGRVFRWTGR